MSPPDRPWCDSSVPPEDDDISSIDRDRVYKVSVCACVCVCAKRDTDIYRGREREEERVLEISKHVFEVHIVCEVRLR